MSTVDFGKRIVQLFWDPEPSNDRVSDAPIWCLGCSYDLSSPPKTASVLITTKAPITDSVTTIDTTSTVISEPTVIEHPIILTPGDIRSDNKDSQPSSVASSFSSSLAYGEGTTTRNDGGWPTAFLDDFESRIWMTYRSGFEPIAKSADPNAIKALSLTMRLKTQLLDQEGFTSDAGWGCMIRTGQSLLANTMAIQRMGRSWRLRDDDTSRRDIISQFADDSKAPYSLHNFVRHGAEACGKFPGEWFGPSATARCIQALANERHGSFRVYCTGDSADVYEDSFMQVAKSDGETFIPTLILVMTRLGIDKVNPVYWEALVATLQMPQSVGIAGGRPSSSHYFVGAQGMFLFYLDPHITQPALPFRTNISEYSREELSTFHTRRLRKLHLKEMDPSMLIGFLIRSEEEWHEWRANIKYVQGRPVISVFDRNPLGISDGRAEAIDEVESLDEADDEMDEEE